VAPQLREILAYKIGVEHSRTAAHVGVSSQRGAEIIYEMSRVSGLEFGLPVFVLSPLRIEGASIEIALDFLERGLDVRAELTGMPILGLTAPLWLPGAFVEHVATVLAAYTLFDAAGLAERLRCHFAVYPFDMKYGTIAYGTPMHALAHLVGCQVNGYYGAPTDMCKAFHTNAARPDAHSVSQRAAFGALAALAGARRFTFGGMLGIDMIFSAEQLVVDVEIMDYLKHLVQGCKFPGGDAIFETLKEVGPGGDFLTHASTLAGYRDLWVSDLFQDLSVEQIDARHEAGLQDRIRRRVRALLDSAPYEADKDVVRELDRIYRAAVRELT
jgi:trimethylamine--corrinoid protein Co-methyltransferase